ncbi:MAG: DUF3048 domain-containing protein [Ardenticatenaceae bacterium]|nr:DUF3048 domain-containing protein [Ardenticatenaceae bacterium]
MQRSYFWQLLLLLIVSLTACGAETAVSTATPTRTPTRTPLAVSQAAPSPTITNTPPSTATAVPPTIMPPTPTAVTPTRLAATAVPPTATIPGLLGVTGFPDGINPLTGLATDPARLARRPIAIKISNYPPLVRPQAGLNSADLVFEHLAEGNVTRFTAVFYSQDANPVGSIRSGRLIDLEIPLMYDAAFAYSGSAGPVRLMFKESEFFGRIISPDFAHGGFYRVADPDKPVVHTLFTDTDTLHYLLGERGEDRPPVFENYMAFRDEPLAAGTPATQIEIAYGGTYVTWSYAGNGRYTRWTDGEPHYDANTGQQLSFTNIIVLAAHHQETDIQEDDADGGHNSIQIQIWGEGPVSIFRDGQRFDGYWHRDDPHHMLTFTDLDGNILPLAPGNSFFQLVPLGFDKLYVKP